MSSELADVAPLTRAEARVRNGRRRPPARDRSTTSRVVSVTGELLLTSGVVVLLFITWKLWWNDSMAATQQASDAGNQSLEWSKAAGANPVPGNATGSQNFGNPIVDASAKANGEVFAVIYIPRYGEGTQRNVAEGVGLDVLNSSTKGVGAYPGTAAPGAVGNFAVAGHRDAYGGSMHKIQDLRVGDPIYVQTKAAWFTYTFRNYLYVTPTSVQSVDPVPFQPSQAATDRLITLTTCNPLYSTAERIAAYGALTSWRPASAGPPPEIAPDVAKWKAA